MNIVLRGAVAWTFLYGMALTARGPPVLSVLVRQAISLHQLWGRVWLLQLMGWLHGAHCICRNGPWHALFRYRMLLLLLVFDLLPVYTGSPSLCFFLILP